MFTVVMESDHTASSAPISEIFAPGSQVYLSGTSDALQSSNLKYVWVLLSQTVAVGNELKELSFISILSAMNIVTMALSDKISIDRGC